MIASIPKEVYSLEGKRAIIKANATRYRESTKKEKTLLLNELCTILHWTRSYIARLLRGCGKVIYFKGVRFLGEWDSRSIHRRGRKKIYSEEIVPYLLKIWRVAGYISSKHLRVYISANSDKLFSHPELVSVSEEIKEKLLKISPATIDRLLKQHRWKLRAKGKYKSNPFSSNVKRAVPTESYFDKRKETGDMEVDILYHSGESAKGEFFFTLTATEVTTDWTELRLLKNKAMVWTVEALKSIISDMPINVKSIHTDNGSEFLNHHMYRFCQEKGIKFRRSRPYRKNDAPYVESKNWSLVRRYTGWRRYDSEEEGEILRTLLYLLSLRHNIFTPTIKTKGKVKEGDKVRVQKDINTPYNRVLELSEVSEETKEKLKAMRANIDLFELSERIEMLEKRLDKAYQIKVRRYNNE
ncbi:transposase family protein [bacterium]|nr:transposase family protein [bacterium]